MNGPPAVAWRLPSKRKRAVGIAIATIAGYAALRVGTPSERLDS